MSSSSGEHMLNFSWCAELLLCFPCFMHIGAHADYKAAYVFIQQVSFYTILLYNLVIILIDSVLIYIILLSKMQHAFSFRCA
jgi:hypothetical protein